MFGLSHLSLLFQNPWMLLRSKVSILMSDRGFHNLNVSDYLIISVADRMVVRHCQSIMMLLAFNGEVHDGEGLNGSVDWELR